MLLVFLFLLCGPLTFIVSTFSSGDPCDSLLRSADHIFRSFKREHPFYSSSQCHTIELFSLNCECQLTYGKGR